MTEPFDSNNYGESRDSKSLSTRERIYLPLRVKAITIKEGPREADSPLRVACVSDLIKRILVYTHNAIGLGHAFRTLAVITGMRHWRPAIDFLVLSGTSVPQIFLEAGIEVIRLPTVKLLVDSPEQAMKPRYLTRSTVDEVFAYRRQLIRSALDFLAPDVFMVEHNMGGLRNEIVPLLLERQQRPSKAKEFLPVHLSRGIINPVPQVQVYPGKAGDLPAPMSIAHLYELVYVLEERATVDVHKEYCGNEAGLEGKIHYLGRITARTRQELADPREVRQRFGLVDRKVILLSLCRHGPVLALTQRLLEAVAQARLTVDHQIVIVADPYLDEETLRKLRVAAASRGALLLPFIPHLVDLMNAAELVICRAGYNTVNEVLMTGVRALIIPERHPSGEQERRAGGTSSNGVRIVGEDEVLLGRPETMIRELLARQRTPGYFTFDKYAIGRRLIDDLEAHLSGAVHGVS